MRGERLNNGLSVLTTGDGPPVVFLPGLGPGADLSQGVPRAMARAARAVALGLRRTVHMINRPIDMPSGTTIAELADWHATALHERFGEPIDITGTSAGGATALQLAMDHPTAVRRLAISVAASRGSDRGRRDLLRIVKLEQEGKPVAWFSSGLVAHGLPRLLTAAAYALGGNEPRAPGEAALIEAFQNWDVTDRLAEIVTPTLIVGGTRDPIVPPELTRATAQGIPDARLVLLRGRDHTTTLFDPRATRAVRNFLDERTPES